jgi:hypothetical protein
MKKEIQKISNKTLCYAQQLPLSVAYLIKTEDQRTKRFMYRNTDTKETFINNWLNALFNDAKEIYNHQCMYYDKLDLPQYVLNKLSFDKSNKYNISVKVIGFNSKKFDINIFVNYITDPKIRICSIIGTETQYKSLTLEHSDYLFKLHFLDLKSFLADGNLDKYSMKFSQTLTNTVLLSEVKERTFLNLNITIISHSEQKFQWIRISSMV